jgi:hypothetical protein
VSAERRVLFHRLDGCRLHRGIRRQARRDPEPALLQDELAALLRRLSLEALAEKALRQRIPDSLLP